EERKGTGEEFMEDARSLVGASSKKKLPFANHLESELKFSAEDNITTHLIDTEKKFQNFQAVAAASSMLSLGNKRHVVVLAIEPQASLAHQFNLLQIPTKILEAKVILALPQGTSTELMSEVRKHSLGKGIEEQNVVCSIQDLTTLIRPPSVRQELLISHIENKVIKVLVEEQERLRKKYDIIYSPVHRRHQLDINVNSKDLPSIGKKTSRETAAERNNAVERCAKVEETIVALRIQAARITAEQTDDQHLEATIDLFKKIIKKNIVGFDKHKGEPGWGRKFGYMLLDILTGISFVLFIPLAVSYGKKKIAEKMKDPAAKDSGLAKVGTMLGLSATGMWFRLEGKTHYEGKEILRNLKTAAEDIKEEEKLKTEAHETHKKGKRKGK
ncbi:MAG TPA: hypothetical protein VLH77_04105, partial [Gammaproteobacteria bacterium]|nr:hypothetical protein [Gammaproteobacteria bacterium]